MEISVNRKTQNLKDAPTVHQYSARKINQLKKELTVFLLELTATPDS
jgi:hypothetical protein